MVGRRKPIVLSNPPADDIVSTGHIADKLGVTTSTVRNWVRRYGMPVARMGAGQSKRMYLSEAEVMKWLKQQGML